MPSPVDNTSFVLWLQTSKRCGDLRLATAHPGHPSHGNNGSPLALRQPHSLGEASGRQLLAMSEGDGWLGCCQVSVNPKSNAGVMRGVADWYEDESCAGLPTSSKWPEVGEMRRVGEAMLEFAPSGACAWFSLVPRNSASRPCLNCQLAVFCDATHTALFVL